MSTKRKIFIVGNWKMNPQTFEDAKKIWKQTSKTAANNKKIKVIACPPYTFIKTLSQSKSTAFLGAQDISIEERGSFTGSVSSFMVRDAGAKFVILGHSERRREGDTDEKIGKKVSLAIASRLIPIICIGEEVRDNEGKYLDLVAQSIRTIGALIPEDKLSQVIVAYEPVWAVGKSYDTALSPEDIHQMIIFIRKVFAEKFPKKSVMDLPVLYGGSVDLENAKKILGDGEVSGLLIGRQSLEQGFSEIISHAGNL